MIAALIVFSKEKTAHTEQMIRALQEAACSRCEELRVLDGYRLQDHDRLAFYGYIALFFAEKPFFTTQPEPAPIDILKAHGIDSTAKGCVLTMKKGLFSTKFSRNTMNKLETVGFKIDYFSIMKNENDARRAGANIG